eukprot:scaffold770_cov255-Pinguiococcus_pyrenoidosus.AAC.34
MSTDVLQGRCEPVQKHGINGMRGKIRNTKPAHSVSKSDKIEFLCGTGGALDSAADMSAKDADVIEVKGPDSQVPPEMAAQLAELDRLARERPAEFEAMLKATEDLSELQKRDPEAFKRFTADEELQKAYGASLADRLKHAEENASAGGGSALRMPGQKGIVLGDKGTETKTKGKRVVPEPGFVVKTRSLDGSGDALAEEAAGGLGLVERSASEAPGKVFVNVCVSAEIAKPRKVKRLDENGNEVEGISIPVSVGELRRAVDQKSNASHVCDVIVSQEVYDDAVNDATGGQKDFIVSLCLQYVEQKYKLRLDRRYKLPRLKYKYGLGEADLVGALAAKTEKPEEASKKLIPMAQWVRDEAAAPKIEEVGDWEGAAKAAKKPPPKKKARQMEPVVLDAQLSVAWREDTDDTEALPWPEGPGDVVLLPLQTRMYREDGGQVPRYMKITVSGFRSEALEEGTRLAEQLSVEASAFLVTVSAPGHVAVDLHLPYSPDLDGISAELVEAEKPGTATAANASSHSLVLLLPCAIQEWEVEPDPGSKAHLLACAIEVEKQAKQEQEQIDGQEQEPVEEQKQEPATSAEEPPSSLEDRFHLRSPQRAADSSGGVGVAGLDLRNDEERPVQDEDELPEDRFHRADALSTHYISQRQDERDTRLKRHEQEKAERAKDDSIEYIDVDDLKPGGKYGRAVADGAAPEENPAEGSEELELVKPDREVQLRASKVLEDRVAEREQEAENTGDKGNTDSSRRRVKLKSSLWAELL